MTNRTHHEPVLLEETLSFLALGPGALVVDATIGDGGHAVAILNRIGPGGRLLGIDCDEEALRVSAKRLAGGNRQVELVHSSFKQIDQILEETNNPQIHGILLDLGVSSRQVDEPSRGFTFRQKWSNETPLDMRMDRSRKENAADLIARASEKSLEYWFRSYGDLKGSRRLAKYIVEARKKAPLRSSQDLIEVIQKSGVGRGRRHNPATLVFQALRIAVNEELDALKTTLEIIPKYLAIGARIVVISYHSLEDRIVKNIFRDLERGCKCPPGLPICQCGYKPLLRRLVRRPVRPSEDEQRANPRSRSARLRVAERILETT